MRLQGRVVFITGASRGIGRACAIGCAKEGADVVVAARTEVAQNPLFPGTIHEVAREIEALGRRALPLRLDVRDDAACEQAVEEAAAHFGRIDALVNNAGALWWADVVETPVKKFDHVMSVNLRASFVLSRAALPHMIKQRWGHIVMMSPPAEASDCSHHGAYAVSKIGMTLLAQAIAEEVKDQNVTAHALWPTTEIESTAARSFALGAPGERRRAEIMADALVGLLARNPSDRRGRAWFDETVLRADGVLDFSKYQAVPNTDAEAASVAAPARPSGNETT